MLKFMKKNKKTELSSENLAFEEQNLSKDNIVPDDSDNSSNSSKNRLNLFKNLKMGLDKTSSKINKGLSKIFVDKKLDRELLEELEDLLITSDIGVKVASAITDSLSEIKFDKNITVDEVKAFLVEHIMKILKPVEKSIELSEGAKPYVILFCGVNGSGKTTTIGKYAKNYTDKGKKVILAACDTFRAAAKEQLNIWAVRADVPIISGSDGVDPASVAYKAMERAKLENFDILLIDTAGRLQNKKGLMDQLVKISNVVKKLDPSAPHENIIVLDATTGQNANSQVKIFNECIGLSGIVINKLDGSAKGGVVVSIAEDFSLPIYSIGVGEKLEDMQSFDAKLFSETLVGIN